MIRCRGRVSQYKDKKRACLPTCGLAHVQQALRCPASEPLHLITLDLRAWGHANVPVLHAEEEEPPEIATPFERQSTVYAIDEREEDEAYQEEHAGNGSRSKPHATMDQRPILMHQPYQHSGLQHNERAPMQQYQTNPSSYSPQQYPGSPQAGAGMMGFKPIISPRNSFKQGLSPGGSMKASPFIGSDGFQRVSMEQQQHARSQLEMLMMEQSIKVEQEQQLQQLAGRTVSVTPLSATSILGQPERAINSPSGSTPGPFSLHSSKSR